MITLDKTTLSLMGVLDHTVTTQPRANVVFSDENTEGQDTKYASQQTAFNHATAVTICNAPQQNYTRNIESLTIYNADSAAVSTRLYVYDTAASTSTYLINAFLQPVEILGYEDNLGYYAMTSTGARK